MARSLLSTTSAPSARPNPFRDPVPFNRVRVAGILAKATAVKFNGMKVEDNWKKQKSKESNGAVFSFGGTDPVGGESGFSVTFRCAADEDSTAEEQFDQLYDIYDALKPVAVFGGAASSSSSSSSSSTSSVGSPPKPDSPATAEQLLQKAQNALQALNNPTPAATSTDATSSSSSSSSSQASPGPRPPTVPIELGWLAFLGVFACARKSFEFSAIEQDKIEVTIGWVADTPTSQAGAGAMAAPSAATPGSQFGAVAPPTPSQIKGGAAAGAAGT